MESYTDLKPLAQRLRLGCILNSLEIRVKEAHEGGQGYTEFLKAVLADEIDRRENQYVTRLQRNSGLNPGKTLEAYDWSYNNHDKRFFRDLATCRFMDENAPAIIVGHSGVGKSHIAQAIGNQAVRQGRSVTFVTQADLLDRLAASRISGSYRNMLGRLSKVDLLVIDDLALTPLDDDQAEDLHRIVVSRYERHSTMITSNLHPTEWECGFENKYLANAIVDRLRDRAYIAVLTGRSYRQPAGTLDATDAAGGR
jgi:DNA replication protein DnaC